MYKLLLNGTEAFEKLKTTLDLDIGSRSSNVFSIDGPERFPCMIVVDSYEDDRCYTNYYIEYVYIEDFKCA